MPEYDPQRRIDAVKRLGVISKSEAAEGTDLRRTTQYELAREATADELKAAQRPQRRSFANALDEASRPVSSLDAPKVTAENDQPRRMSQPPNRSRPKK